MTTPEPSLSEPSFLYIEDDPMSREIMEMMLRSSGYSRVTVFEDSEDFMSRIEALPAIPTVIFLDIHMKPYSGFEMLEALLKRPAYTAPHIIAVTASVMNEEVVQLKAAGFFGAIAKPLDFEQFAQLIDHVLQHKPIWHIG